MNAFRFKRGGLMNHTVSGRDLGKVLRCIRLCNDTTLMQLTAKGDISTGYLSEIENGRRKASLYVLEMYANVFDVPLGGILFFCEYKDSPEILRKMKRYLGAKALSIIERLAGVSE